MTVAQLARGLELSLFALGLLFVVVNLRVGREILRWWRRRRHALLVWAAPRPPYYALNLAIGVMLVAAGPLARFVEEHPAIKMLALSFLLLIGMSLVAEGLDLHMPKGYIYFAMGFSVFVELLNLRVRGRGQPVQLRPYPEEERPLG